MAQARADEDHAVDVAWRSIVRALNRAMLSMSAEERQAVLDTARELGISMVVDADASTGGGDDG